MHVVHRGFDTIVLAIEANISAELNAALDAARDAAEDARRSLPFTYGGADFDIRGYGGNGYRYILQGGPLEATWFFKKPNPRDPWGIRISIGSAFLATQGLGAARAYIDNTLTRLGVQFEAHQVSIARADFCVDILAPDFVLNPDQLVIHSHANRADYLTSAPDLTSNGKSGAYTSVTAGKMPGRQVIIYDKRREMIDKHKPIWWDIWNANLARADLPPLDPTDASQSRVWRIEIRAGKRLLNDRWNIRRWADLDAKFGDVVAEAYDKVRYCLPSATDTNRARWPLAPIWELAAHEAEGDLFEMRNYLAPDAVKHVHREEQIRIILALVAGNMTTLAALEGVEAGALQDYAGGLGKRVGDGFAAEPERAEDKLNAAAARYRFI